MDIKAKTFLGEYLGEVVSSKEYYRRQETSLAEKHQFVYQLKPGTYLDASTKGSIYRFINHSCEPNCYVEPDPGTSWQDPHRFPWHQDKL